MKLTDNEKTLVKALVDYEAHVNEATQYLKETYNIDAKFNIEDSSVTLSKADINESDFVDNMIDAKMYLNDLFPNEMLTIYFN